MSIMFKTLLSLFFLTFSIFGDGALARPPKCVSIPIQHCKSVGYNQTRFPNFAGDDSERAAIDEFTTFEPLISVGCSELLTFFLCASYFPLCNEKVPQPIGPCQPLCTKVRDQCVGVLSEFGFPWPSHLECSKFPTENNEEHMCMEGFKQFSTPKHHTFHQPTHHHPHRISNPASNMVINNRCTSTAYVYMNRTARCVPKCDQTVHFSTSDTHATRSALIVGSVLSFVLTTSCLLCSCLGRTMSRRPVDNTLFYCAFCFAFSAAIYLLSVFQKDKIACFTYQTYELFVVPGIPHVPCTLVATLLYYSGMSARLWWICACTAWRMSMREQTHVFSWTSPFAMVTVALMAQAAQADPLSGICLVGASSNTNYQMFVLLRDLVLVIVSVLVLVSGFLASVQSTNSEGFWSSSGLGEVVNGGSCVCSGIICVLFPMAQTFWLLAGVQHVFAANSLEPVLGVGSLAKHLADPSMGALLGGALFIYLLHACWWDTTVNEGISIKNGYQPAHPLYPPPQPQQGALQANINCNAVGNLTSTTSCPMTASSQRSSANMQQPSYGTAFVPPQQPPPPPPPLASLRQLANC